MTVSCANTPYNSLQALATSGCYEVDKTFSDFAASTNTFSTGPVGLGSIYLDGSSSGYSSLAPYTVSTQFFNDSGGGAFSAKNSSGDFTELVNSNNAGGSDLSYPSGAIPNIITSVSLSASGKTGNMAGDSNTIEEKFCFGTSSCGGNYVTLKIVFSGSNVSTPTTTSCVITGTVSGALCGTGASAIISPTAQVMNLTVENAFELTTTNGGPPTLNSFTDVFGEMLDTPEPSTFLLFGGSLAAVASMMRRRHRSRKLLS